MIQKLCAVAAATGLLFSLAGLTPAYNENQNANGEKPGQKIERSLRVSSQSLITLCVASGTLTITGWDKQDVRVRSADAEQIEFRRIDKTKDPNVPPTHVDVMVSDNASRANPKRDCQAIADVDMEVPAGATVQVQTFDGDIYTVGVATVYAGSQNGDINIERATRLVEAGSLGGSILLKDSSGRMSLSSASGGVEAVNVRGATDDTFEVGTVSGDIQLDRISTPKVTAKTVSGTMMMTGPLAKSGYYAFTNVTGNLLLALPHDASFRLNAKVSDKQDIISDFVLKYLGETPTPPSAPTPMPRVVPVAPANKATAVAGAAPKQPPAVKDPKTPVPKEKEKPAAKGGTVTNPPVIVIEKPAVTVAPYVRRVEAICGTGDATISVASFGGTVRLKKL